MAEIIWTKKARLDLKGIHEFISEDSVFYANRFIAKLIGLIDVLENFPTVGRVVPEYEILLFMNSLRVTTGYFIKLARVIGFTFFVFTMLQEK